MERINYGRIEKPFYMTECPIITEKLQVAVINEIEADATPEGRAIGRILDSIRSLGIGVADTVPPSDVRAIFSVLTGVDAVLVNWNIGREYQKQDIAARDLILRIRETNEEIPIFLMGEPESPAFGDISIEMIREIDEYIWIMEDTPEFIAGRIGAAARRYRHRLLPPFFSKLVNFSHDFEYSWHTPGHAGGVAFWKSPIGRVFHRFFGEQLFRSDLSVSVEELGSLLDHSGPIGEAEQYAARVFGADQTYFVTNGTSSANKIVFCGVVTAGDIVLLDRNCHKSCEQAVTLTNSIPVYLMPSRNRYGIIGPIPASEMTTRAIVAKIRKCPLTSRADRQPVLAVITNSTYDGLCSKAEKIEEVLGKITDNIMFDEAWFAHARFNPLYRDRFAMRDKARDSSGPTVFATQSSHKLLAALSQASMIHVRNGRVPVHHARFNESFMMHSSTSPLYPILASLDISSRMMDGAPGKVMTAESVSEAIRFRRTMARIRKEIEKSRGTTGKDWWFSIWQPETVTDPETKKKIVFEDAPFRLLRDDPSAWILNPGDAWHGFSGLTPGYCMLDPIKVTIITPGIRGDGSLAQWGIPAAIVEKFLETRGIVCEKVGDYTLLFLFSLGVTQGKWGTLVSEFFEFKRFFDRDSALDEVFPELIARYPGRYKGMTLRGLSGEMHRFKRERDICGLLENAFGTLPEPVLTYADAYSRLVKNEVEYLPIEDSADRITATGIVPYPPGIPLLAPGERTGKTDGPVLRYLLALQDFDNTFPGFAHDIHGIRNIDGKYMMFCVKENTKRKIKHRR